MQFTLNRFVNPFSLAIVLLLLLVFGDMESHADEAPLSQTTFYVYWYDVGKAALVGLDGVKKVKSGWHNLKEINTVYYDPSEITIEEMEDALKKVHTFQGRVEAKK